MKAKASEQYAAFERTMTTEHSARRRGDWGLIVHGNDYTPRIACRACGEELVADDNGNAPLIFDLNELANALVAHECEGPGV